MQKFRQAIVFCLVLFVAFSSVRLTNAQTDRTPGGTLVVGTEPMGDSLEPAFWSGFGSIAVLDNIGEGLVRSDFTNGEPKPGLAKSWDISADGLTYTFHLRAKLKFHDETPVTAQAIVRSLTRHTDKTDSSFVDGYMHYGHGAPNIVSLTADDEQTVKLVLKVPDATMLHRLSRPSAYAISPAALDKYGKKIGEHLVMAGPFKLDSFTPGQEAVMTPFADYWAGAPIIDKLIIKGFVDEGSVLAALQSGQVNFTTAAPLLAVPSFEKSDKVRVEVGPALIDLFLGVNLKDPVVGNRDIRMAINYGIDRDKLIQVALNGYAKPPSSILSPIDLGFDDSGSKTSHYDLALAKQHIEKSGMKTPIPLKLSFEAVRFWPQLAAVIKEDLDKAGFAVTLEPRDSTLFWENAGKGAFQLNLNQRSTFVPDPNDKALILQSSGSNGAFGLDTLDSAKKMDALVDSGTAELDQAKRIEIYKQIQALALEDLPFIYLGYLTPPVFVSKSLRDIPIDGAAAGRATFYGAWFSK